MKETTKITRLTFHPDYIPILKNHYEEFIGANGPNMINSLHPKQTVYYYPVNKFQLNGMWPFRLLFVIRFYTNKESTLNKEYISKRILKILHEEYSSAGKNNYMIIPRDEDDFFVLQYQNRFGS